MTVTVTVTVSLSARAAAWPAGAQLGPRAQLGPVPSSNSGLSLSKMMRIVQNERLKFEIDSESVLRNSTLQET